MQIVIYYEIIQGRDCFQLLRLSDLYSRLCLFIQLLVVLYLLHYHFFSLHWPGGSIFSVHLSLCLCGMICFLELSIYCEDFNLI